MKGDERPQNKLGSSLFDVVLMKTRGKVFPKSYRQGREPELHTTKTGKE